jgi:capsular polysaccharide biosynthesis protein
MELKLYLQILLKRWWIILTAFVFTLIPTLLFVNSQPWIYETEATFVIRPRSSIAINDDEIVKALDTISRRVEINTTFAEVTSSSLIMGNAIERLALTAEERKGLKVNGKVIAGTNILEIGVQGPDPEVVRDFANAVSLETLIYVRNLYDVFELEPLDEAELPSDPVSPNKALNLTLGGSLGLFLGVGLIFLIEYLKEPIKTDFQVNIIDFETGAYNRPFFMLRLRQELNRARHNGYSFSLALIKVYHRGLMKGVAQPIPAAQALRLIITSLGPNMREEDVLAYMEQGTFALLLPDIPGEAAKDVLTFLRMQIGLVPPGQIDGGQGSAIYGSIGVAAYDDHQLVADENEMLAQAVQALEEADTAVYGKVHLLSHRPPLSPPLPTESASLAHFFQKQTGETSG